MRLAPRNADATHSDIQNDERSRTAPVKQQSRKQSVYFQKVMAKQYAADHCQSNNQQPQEMMFFGPKACRGANDGQILDNPISTLKCNTGGRQSLSSGRSAWPVSQDAPPRRKISPGPTPGLAGTARHLSMSCDPGARAGAARRRPGAVVRRPPAVRPDADCPRGPAELRLRGAGPPGQRPLENFRRGPVVQRLARPVVEQVLHAVRRDPACRSPSGSEPARSCARSGRAPGTAARRRTTRAPATSLRAANSLPLSVVRTNSLYGPRRLCIASPVSPAVLHRASNVNLEARSTSDSAAPR